MARRSGCDSLFSRSRWTSIDIMCTSLWKVRSSSLISKSRVTLPIIGYACPRYGPVSKDGRHRGLCRAQKHLLRATPTRGLTPRLIPGRHNPALGIMALVVPPHAVAHRLLQHAPHGGAAPLPRRLEPHAGYNWLAGPALASAGIGTRARYDPLIISDGSLLDFGWRLSLGFAFWGRRSLNPAAPAVEATRRTWGT